MDGIGVVTLEHAVAAPCCTRQLADLGARVIKVERPGRRRRPRQRARQGHGFAPCWSSHSKELTLDVKHPDAQKVLAQLLASP